MKDKTDYCVNCNAVYSQRYDNKEDSIYEDLYYLYNPPPYNYRDPFTYPYRSSNTWNLDITKVASSQEIYSYKYFNNAIMIL